MTRQHQHESREVASRSYRQVGPQRSLFDPANPHKPIMVASRDDVTNQPIPVGCPEMSFQSLPADQGNTSSRPTWYDPQSERYTNINKESLETILRLTNILFFMNSFRSSKSHPHLLMDIMRCDVELTWLLQGHGINQRFSRIQMNRYRIKCSHYC